MKKNNILLLILVLVATVCHAQTNLELADASYNNKDYAEAIVGEVASIDIGW